MQFGSDWQPCPSGYYFPSYDLDAIYKDNKEIRGLVAFLFVHGYAERKFIGNFIHSRPTQKAIAEAFDTE
jgi:hypothetical protein